MGQQGGEWWYSEPEDDRGGGPAVPPNWQQQRGDPYRPPQYGSPLQRPGPQAHQVPQFQPPAPASAPPKKQENHAVTALLLVLILAAGGGFAWWNHHRLGQAPPPRAAAAAAKSSFPPVTPAGFRAFAATGDAGRVHEIASFSAGLATCPLPNRIITVSPAVTGRALEADLSAYFVENGLLGSKCGAAVFAYHSMSDYRKNKGNGYTAGRVFLSANGDGGRPYNLEVDTGSAVSTQAEFDFDF